MAPLRFQDNEKDRKTVKVNSKTFDSLFPSIDPKKNLIWMDTQGFEANILLGAKKLISSGAPIVLEFWPYGLKLNNLYLTTALKCVPPEDKPTSKELKTCFNYFSKEISSLKNITIILALGKIGHDACINYYKQHYEIKNKDYVFGHGSKNKLPDNKLIMGSYHPSPRNVNTGRINQNKMVNLLKRVKKELEN